MGRLVGVVVLAAGLAGGVFVSAAGAQDGTVIEIPVDTVVTGAPDSVNLLATVPVDADDVGRECGVVAQGVNNESVHPNSDLLVRSGGDEVVVPDVERAPNARTEATGTLTLGSEVSVFVQLGPDGVFSGGLVVTLDCVLPPPPPPRAVAACVETVNPHGQNVPPAGSTTLPGPRGGQNEDGFYLLTSDPVSAGVVAIDTGSGTVFGPFPSGTKVKYTQAPGATPEAKKIGSDNGQAGAIDFHITGTGDLAVAPADDPAAQTPCLVPPPPK